MNMMIQSETATGKIVFCAVMATVSVLSALTDAARNAASRPRDNVEFRMTNLWNDN
jgi:hypothetical protein